MKPSQTLCALLCLASPLWGGQEIEDVLSAAGRGQRVAVEVLTDVILAQGPEGGQEWLGTLEMWRPGQAPLDGQEAREALDGPAISHLEGVTARVPAEIQRRLAGMDVTQWSAASRCGLDLLARSEGAEELDLCLLLAAPHPEVSYSDYRPRGADLRATVTAMLQVDPSSYRLATRRYGAGHPWIDRYLLLGISGTGTVSALQALPSMLKAVPSLDSAVLFEIGSLARTVKAPLDDSAGMRVRMFLGSTSPEERRQAALTVGRLDDYEAVEELVELLGDEDPAVSASAHWALREITAMTINPEPIRWRVWYERETRWWVEDAHDLLAHLEHEESALVCRSINECARRRLFRRELTPPLLHMLGHKDPNVVRAACSALYALRAIDAAPHMIATLEHGSESVRAHGLAMLRALTGMQLTAEPEGWHIALGSPGQPWAR